MDTAKLIARRISEGKIPASYGTESAKVSRARGYNKSSLNYEPLPKKRGNRWGKKEESTNPSLETHNHFAQKPSEGLVRYCLYCKKELPNSKYHNKMKNQVCNNTCRKLLTLKIAEEERATMEKIKAMNKKHNRKCTVCGRPCYPNYFFCPAHFHSAQELYDIKEVL